MPSTLCGSGRPSAAGSAPSKPLPPGTAPALADVDALAAPAALAKILAAVGLKDREACNVWCGGSRLWGCATADSDFDVYIVHRSRDEAKRVATARVSKPACIDATLLHADEWAARLRMHHPTWLLLLSHPRPWMLRLDPSALGFEIESSQIQSAMLQHSLREWARVHKCFQQEPADVVGGRETLTHLLRTYVLVTQLAGHRSILDYRAAEGLRTELAGYTESTWRWWRDAFEPRLEAMHSGLRHAAQEEREVAA